MLGDSITEGWDGSVDIERPEAYFIQQSLNMPTTNLGHGGGAIIGNQSKDLPQVVSSTDFSQYDLVTIAYGVNDFDGGSGSIRKLTDTLNDQIQLIYESNPNILLVGILPIWGNTDAIKANESPSGYGWDELQDAEKDVYTSNNGIVLDWRSDPIVTPNNFSQLLGDKWLHPTQSTYELLGNRIANFIRDNLGLSLVPYDGIVWHLKDNLNQNFGSLNQRLGIAAGLLNKSISHIEPVTSNSLGRAYRMQMLNGLQTAISDVNELVTVIDDSDLHGINPALPVWLQLDSRFTDTLNNAWDAIDRCLFKVQRLSTQINQ
ncbi:hypothetical protein LROSL3_1568 [Furfurilactobacillus rossiae]|nr:hypothetical protein LROSL2_1567 [Furfurilactobacillus rossiae]QLE69347.1 hypothetical protein LROSL3_1568 [Furfurilactobacillus rossiae]